MGKTLIAVSVIVKLLLLMSQCFQYQKLRRKIRRSQNAYMVEKQLAEVEAEIARLEATMKMYEVQLANPVVQQDLDEMSKIPHKSKRLRQSWNPCIRSGNV